jgi:hypothetical protein
VGLGAQHARQVRKLRRRALVGDVAVVDGLHGAALDRLDVAARQHPGFARAWQATLDHDLRGGVGVGARGVVERHRLLARARMQLHLAEWHAQVDVAHARLVDLSRSGDRFDGDSRDWLVEVHLGFRLGA